MTKTVSLIDSEYVTINVLNIESLIPECLGHSGYKEAVLFDSLVEEMW